MKWIGITGGIASGKSTVTKMIQDLGGVVIDADVLAREVVQKGSFGLRALVQFFGEQILLPSGELDRSELGKIIFQDQAARTLVERIMHPLIQWRSLQERMLLEEKGLKFAFYDAALIFEKNIQGRFDSVVVVNSTPDVQKKRLMDRDKISGEQATQLIGIQMPLEKKVELAQFVIDNSGDRESLKAAVEKLFAKLSQ